MSPDKQTLLAKYQDRPVQRFLQIDGHVDVAGDDVMDADQEGDTTMITITDELMRSPGKHLPLRILIHEDASPEDVRRLLVKAVDSLDAAYDFFREYRERELFGRAGIPPF